MAIKTTKDPDPQVDVAPGATSSFQPASQMHSLYERYVIPTLTEAEKLYRDRVEEELKLAPIDISREDLLDPESASIFISGKYAVVMMFDEAIGEPQRTPFAPKSVNVDLATKKIRQHEHLRDIRILTSIVVRKSDYPKATAMANFISNLFQERAEKDDFTVDYLSGGSTSFIIDTDIRRVQADISRFYPHSVLPAMNAGLTVALKMPGQDQFSRENLVENQKPVLSISVLVDFLQDFRYGEVRNNVPVVRITNITSPFPHPALTYIGLVLVAEHFCKNDGWLEPFYTFNNKGPNLGNLAGPDAKDPKKLVSCQTPDEVRRVAQMKCLPAQLAIDVVEGQANSWAISALIEPAEKANVEQYISDFFFQGTPVPSLPTFIEGRERTEYIGYYTLPSGVEVDTRSLTYLEAVARSPGLAEESAPLLNWTAPHEMEAKADFINKLTDGFQSSHLCTTVAIHEDFLTLLSQAISQNRIDLTTDKTAITAGFASFGNLETGLKNMPSVIAPHRSHSPFSQRTRFSGF